MGKEYTRKLTKFWHAMYRFVNINLIDEFDESYAVSYITELLTVVRIWYMESRYHRSNICDFSDPHSLALSYYCHCLLLHKRKIFLVFSISLRMHTYTHSVLCIRNAYKKWFLGLVKIFEEIRNRLVIFQKIREKNHQILVKTRGSLENRDF